MINYRDAAIAGLICGAAGLVSPLLLTMSAALAIQMVYRHGRMILPPMLVSAAIAAMVLLPWAARNRIVLGKWIWTRSNLGLELLVSNQNDSSPLLGGNIGPGRIHSREHPFLNQDRYQYIIAVGEVAVQQEQGDRAWAWIRSHPKEFGRLCVARFLLFWLPVINAATLTRQSVALSAVMLLGLL